MPKISTHTQDAMRNQLEGIAKSISDISPWLSQAIQNVLTAMDYADETLIKVHRNSVAEALRGIVEDLALSMLQESHVFAETLREVWNEHIAGMCGENFDQVGKDIEKLIDKQLEGMTSLRDGAIKTLARAEYPIESASDLEKGIKALQELKDHLLRDWPWSDRPLPPVNRQMVADSKAAIARGEQGERIEDLIRRLEHDSSI